MASTLFLIRENRQYVQYTDVTEITLTGARKSYSSVTGVAATDILTIVNNTLTTGMPVYFQSIAGGANLVINMTYWVIGASGNTFQLALTPGGAAIDFTTNITAGVLISTQDEIFVWSGEYRDQFQVTAQIPLLSYTSSGTAVVAQNGGQVVSPSLITTLAGTVNTGTGVFNLTPTLGALSDEAAHEPLRQTALRKTHWKFDMGSNAAPRYLFAEWMSGDTIANNPPNSVVSA